MRNSGVKTMPIKVRLDGVMRQRLHAAARRMGVKASGVVKLAVIRQLRQIECNALCLDVQNDQK